MGVYWSKRSKERMTRNVARRLRGTRYSVAWSVCIDSPTSRSRFITAEAYTAIDTALANQLMKQPMSAFQTASSHRSDKMKNIPAFQPQWSKLSRSPKRTGQTVDAIRRMYRA